MIDHIYFCAACGEQTKVIGKKAVDFKDQSLCSECTDWYEIDTYSLWSSILIDQWNIR